MNSKSPARVGVLNMTICFQQPNPTQRSKREDQHKSNKMQPVPIFIPRCSLPRQNNTGSGQRQPQQLSPYQRYHYSQRESIRYFRERYQSTKQQDYISGLNPKSDNTIQLQFNDSLHQKQEKVATTAKEPNDGHIKLFFNKRHLRDSVELDKQSKTHQLGMYSNGNPEQTLRSIFTVRTIKTSIRSRRKSNSNVEQRLVFRTPKTRQQIRSKEKNMEESTLKNIRPWSPTRHYFNKEAMFQSQLLAPLSPQLNTIQ